MNKQEKITAIEAKIRELVPSTAKWSIASSNNGKIDGYASQPTLHLEHVLLAIEQSVENFEKYADIEFWFGNEKEDANMLAFHTPMTAWHNHDVLWYNLTKSFHENLKENQELVEFLYNVLEV